MSETKNTEREIKDGLKALIVARLKLNIEAGSIKDELPLFGAAGQNDEVGGLSLDSVEALEIVVGIEEKWGVVIEDDSVANEFFSIDTLGNLVMRLLESTKEASVA
ncbi:MAG TPA: acyl carrier protein [Thermoanaerobaculia bacterium]